MDRFFFLNMAWQPFHDAVDFPCAKKLLDDRMVGGG